MCGIFAYLNYVTPKTREEIINFLIRGLERLEYRGYDSAGIGIDDPVSGSLTVKQPGKVKCLRDEIERKRGCLRFEDIHETHVGIAHTRWATHGVPSEANSHPQTSGDANDFLVVHNGIITNYKDVKAFLEKKGFRFTSETDTEIIAKLIKHIYSLHPGYSFRELVEQVVQQLEGAFALCIKSTKYPSEIVCTRRGSPLLVGIKTKTKLASDHIPVFYSKEIVEKVDLQDLAARG